MRVISVDDLEKTKEQLCFELTNELVQELARREFIDDLNVPLDKSRYTKGNRVCSCIVNYYSRYKKLWTVNEPINKIFSTYGIEQVEVKLNQQNVSPTIKSEVLGDAKCPVCGSMGYDLLFKFYCSNMCCQNYHSKCSENKNSEELQAIIRSMWKMYGRGESMEEFSHRFYSAGGKIEFPPSKIGAGFARVIKPQWLKNRIASGI